MAHPSCSNSDVILAKLLSTAQTSKEAEIPIESEQSDTQNCVVCIERTSNTYDIYTTHTIASGTSIHTFLSKYSQNEHPFTSDVNKYICNTCLQLVNVLDHAEIQYVKLKCTFEAIISKNPLFRSPQSICLACEKDGTQQSGKNGDTGSCDDPKALPQSSVEVKIERNSEDEDVNYSGPENLVDTVMEPDPLDDDISFPEENNDGAARELSQLDTSQEDSTNKPSGTYKCKFCPRRFVQKYHLIDHEIIHTGKKTYQCDVCLRSYNRKGYLLSHIQRSHADVKLYHCDHCPERFIKRSELRTHIKIHAGERFKCEVCNCDFKRKDNYNRHLKTHSTEKERPYECPICQKRFVEKPHLRNHLATHTGEKPFECTVCQCWFNRKGNLQRHMRCHTGEKPYQCEVCQRRFAQKLHLQNHFKNIHIMRKNKHEGRKKRKESQGKVMNKSRNVSNNLEIKKEQIQENIEGNVKIKEEIHDNL